MQKRVNLVDLAKSFQTSTSYATFICQYFIFQSSVYFFVHVPSFLNLFFTLDPNSNEYLDVFSIYLQNFVSIKLRTSPSKFVAEIWNLDGIWKFES